MINPVLDQYNYFIDREGTPIVINNTLDSKCLIKEIEDTKNNDEKWIFAPLDSIRQGDLIDLMEVKWLVMKEEISFNSVYVKGRIQPSNHTVNFNFEGDIVPLNAIVEVTPMQFDTGEYITLYNASLTVTVQDNADSRRVALQQRLINQGQPWIISGWDKSRNGLITFSCELDQFNANDDKENEIPDRWAYETYHEYVLTINEGDLLNATIGTPQTLTITLTDVGVEVTPLPELSYLTSDENILVVDSSGTITPIGVGNASVTVSMIENPNISDSISVTVEEAPIVDNYAITITSSNGTTDNIKLGQTLVYTANVTNNDAAVNDKSVIWEVSNDDGTSNVYVTIIGSTETTITLKATSTSSYVGKYITLKATLSDDELITDELSIRINSIFDKVRIMV
jgi:hypothetical protein